MNRRLFLAAPGLLAAPLVARAGHADAELLHHYRLWAQAKRDWYRHSDLPGNENWDTPEMVNATRREDEASAAMMATPATTMEGMAVLVALLWNVNRPDVSVSRLNRSVETARHTRFLTATM